MRLVQLEDYSIKRAALEINSRKENVVPRMTLSDRLKRREPTKDVKLGRPQELNEEVEQALVKCLVKCAEFNFPMRKRDLQELVQAYCTEHNIATRWPDARPSNDWCKAFLNRWKDTVKLRKPTNIRRSRADLHPDEVTKFFEHIAPSLEGIPATHVFNYDESNLRDDPGSEKAFFSKKTRHCEQVMDHSKVNFTVMFCVSAAGAMVPPMTLYQSTTGAVYDTWCEGGPDGSTYAATKRGWIDTNSFNLWFTSNFIPFIENLPRNKFGKIKK
ncbi:MAG: hypothetical protein FJ333_08900 [Sphingomonadales bacterium]|nr:hypothetical protein [Sphingomonadales bacterium]